MPNTKTITEREMMAVRLSVYYPGRISLPLLYSFAYPGAFADAQALRDLPAVASRWWRSRKVQDFLNSVTAQYKAHQEAEVSRIESECIARLSADGNAHQERGIDFSIPENQRKKLNELINGATDPHDALDALKTMIGRQQDIAPEKKNGPQIRAYLPLTCDQCVIRRIFNAVHEDYPELKQQLQEINNTLK